MSPEQVRGAEVDARSDLFAFGALLYEMLSGEPAFRRETGVETLHAVLKEPAPRLLEEGLGAAGPVLQRALDRCLAKGPNDRYATATDLAADLREARRRLEAPAEKAALAAPAPRAAERPTGPLRVLIVDDEEPARVLLREYLVAAGVEVVAECRNGFEAVKAVNERHPDLVFLDIQMPKLNGFEVLELLGGDVCVVFATAFDDHAIRAFEVNAVDYLLKPVSPERVATALERARARLAAKTPLPVAEIAKAARAGSPATRLVVRQGPRVQVIAVDRLDYAEAQDDYVAHHSEGKSYLKQQTLSDLESSLDPARFVRIHRSYVLNLDRLSRIDTEGGEPKGVLLTDGTRLPLSRSGYGRLKSLL
jgi:two-component system LytT family response regulator